MLSTPVVYNNKIMNLENCINEIFTLEKKMPRIPSCDIHEYNEYYSITISSYIKDIHTFQIYYKNDFLIIQIKLRNNLNKTLSTRMFYLPDINSRKISHIYYDNNAIIKIKKVNQLNFG